MPEYTDSGNEKVECHSCGKKMVKLAKHWNGKKYDCDYPNLTDYEKDVIVGIIMGDGALASNNSVPYIQMDLTNKRFLGWLKKQLWRMGAKFHKISTAEEVAERCREIGWSDNCEVEDCMDVFRFSTSIHPHLDKINERWYKQGSKIFPPELKINNTIAKMWYCCDGDYKIGTTKHHKPIARITSKNEAGRSKYLLSLFEEHGFSPYWEEQSCKISFTVEETPRFLDWLGEAPPGFEYKWGM